METTQIQKSYYKPPEPERDNMINLENIGKIEDTIQTIYTELQTQIDVAESCETWWELT